jgi:hypothetical protein
MVYCFAPFDSYGQKPYPAISRRNCGIRAHLGTKRRVLDGGDGPQFQELINGMYMAIMAYTTDFLCFAKTIVQYSLNERVFATTQRGTFCSVY